MMHASARAAFVLASLLLLASGCASGAAAKGADPECSTPADCGEGSSCVKGKCQAGQGAPQGGSGGGGGVDQGGSGGGGGSSGNEGGASGQAGASGKGGASGQGGASGKGGSGGKSGQAGAAGQGVHCKDTVDGCSCSIGAGADEGHCGKSNHPSSVCCPTASGWPGEGQCSCLEVRSQMTADGCVLGFSSDPLNKDLSCAAAGGVCCLSDDKLQCQCFADKTTCPWGAKVPSCTADRLGCGTGEALSDCQP